MFKKTSIRLELAIDLKVLCGYNSLMLAGWLLNVVYTHLHTNSQRKKKQKRKIIIVVSFINKIMNTNLKVRPEVVSIISSNIGSKYLSLSKAEHWLRAEGMLMPHLHKALTLVKMLRPF